MRQGWVGRRVLAVGVIAGAAVASVVGAVPAAAVTVSTDAQLRSAFADPATTSIALAGDVSLTDCESGDLQRPAAAPALVLDGGGFTITQTCAGFRVIADRGSGLTLRNVTITGGTQTGTAVATDLGGGIYEATGSLTLDHVTVTHNQVSGGGIESVDAWASGGGVYAGGPLTVEASSVSDNTATADGSQGQGGGVYSAVSAHITDSTVNGNTASSGNASHGGGITALGDLTLVNTTVADNVAGGIDGFGGGIEAVRLNLVYSTVVSNGSDLSGNISSTSPLSSAYGSVVADGHSFSSYNECSHPVVSLGHNASGGLAAASPPASDTSCGFTNTAAGDLSPTAPLHLGALAANGGRTETVLPGSGSALIDAIPPEDCAGATAAAVTTDQRGVPRPQGSGCDIGAVEIEQASTPATVSSSTTTTLAAQPAQAVAAEPTFTG
jgi:hypothetical protein